MAGGRRRLEESPFELAEIASAARVLFAFICLQWTAQGLQLQLRLPPSPPTMAISKSAFLKALANCPKSVKSFCMLAYSLSCK